MTNLKLLRKHIREKIDSPNMLKSVLINSGLSNEFIYKINFSGSFNQALDSLTGVIIDEELEFRKIDNYLVRKNSEVSKKDFIFEMEEKIALQKFLANTNYNLRDIFRLAEISKYFISSVMWNTSSSTLAVNLTAKLTSGNFFKGTFEDPLYNLFKVIKLDNDNPESKEPVVDMVLLKYEQ